MLSVQKLLQRRLKFGEKGRSTLVLSSIDRADGLHETFEKVNPLRIHALCRKSYTRPDSVKANKRKSTCHEDVQEASQGPKLRSNTGTFDIKVDCIFCSEPANEDIKPGSLL